MKTLILCVSFYALGVFNCAVFAAAYLLHRPRYVAPTKHRRRWRDLPQSEVVPSWEKAEEEDRVRYQFMGATGFEE